MNAANAAVRLLQCFCRDTAFREILAADKRTYDFVPLMNTFDPIASIIAMDLFGLLSSVSEFTISEGVIFVCKELSQPSTPGSLMKAMETISCCAQNRHYLAYFPDSIRDICRLLVPTKHLNTPDLDTVFIIERALLILLQLTAVSLFSLKLVQGGVLLGLLEIIIEGYTYESRQQVYSICKKKIQHLDLPVLALKVVLSLAYDDQCREALLKSGLPMALMKVLSGAAHQIPSAKSSTTACNIDEGESVSCESKAFSLPSLMTIDTANTISRSNLSLNATLAIEVLYILCLSPFDSTELLVHYPMACEVIVVFWSSDSTMTNDRTIVSQKWSDASTKVACAVLTRLGAGFSTTGLLQRSSQPYTPDTHCVPALSRLPWLLLVETSQVFVLFDIIRYNTLSRNSKEPQAVRSVTFDNSPAGMAPEPVGPLEGERLRTLDVKTAYEGKVTAASALHAVILADAVSPTSTTSPFSAVRRAVVSLCADEGLFYCLESLALSSLEAASLLSEIFSWKEVNFRYTTPTFTSTVLDMLESTHVLLQRTAIKMLFNAVQHSPSSKVNLQVHMPRNVVFAVTRDSIRGCLLQLRSRSDPLYTDSSALDNSAAASVRVSPSEINASLCHLSVEEVTQLLLECLVVATCYFDRDAGGKSDLSQDEVEALAVACGGLIEILESAWHKGFGTLSATSASLWNALLTLCEIKECAQVLVNTNLLRFIKICLKSDGEVNTHDNGLQADRSFESSSSLKILIKIMVNFPLVLTEQLLREDFYPLLFSLLKESHKLTGSKGTAHEGHIVGAGDGDINFQVMSLLCLSSYASLPVCKALTALQGFVAWCLSSVTELYSFLRQQGSQVGCARGESEFKHGVAGDDQATVQIISSTQNFGDYSQSQSLSPPLTRNENQIYISLEQRVALLANISRCPEGKASVFSSSTFVSLLSKLVLSGEEVFVPSGITFAILSLLLALVPLYHCPSSYPHSTLSSSYLEGNAVHDETIVAQLLLATLAVSASNRDLNVVDKVS